MEKFIRLLVVMAAIPILALFFIGCEHVIHYVQSLSTIRVPAAVALWLVALIGAADLVVIVLKFAFHLEIKPKIVIVFELYWGKALAQMTGEPGRRLAAKRSEPTTQGHKAGTEVVQFDI